MKRLRSVSRLSLFTGILFLIIPFVFQSAAHAKGANYLNNKCVKCHTEFKKMNNVVAGDFESRSNKAKSIQVKLGKKYQVIKFTPDTKVVNSKSVKALKKPVPVLVSYTKVGSDLVASEIKAKPVIKVPEEELLDVKEVMALVAQGPEKGKYTLLDSRPPIRYKEGHIPTAISMPFGAMPKMIDKLPEDKNQLVVFYCGGFR